VRFTPVKSEPLLRLLIADLVGEPVTRESVDITERTAAQIVSDLVQAGYLTKTRNGRRNSYEIHDELPLSHPRHRHHTVGELIRFLQDPAEVAADSQPEAAKP
jgi:hypothetical protein